MFVPTKDETPTTAGRCQFGFCLREFYAIAVNQPMLSELNLANERKMDAL